MPAAPAGYSGKPIAAKLGLKPGLRLLSVAAPAHYAALLGPALAAVAHEAAPSLPADPAPADIVHLFVPDRAALADAHAGALAAVAPGGMLWVSWPKKASPLFRDLTEDGIRAVLLPTGWVDVKVAAIDRDWSGLKFLRRRTG
ncbi:MAG: DUF3052 domain-containing protein [Alphaproteobacteria bacterium]